MALVSIVLTTACLLGLPAAAAAPLAFAAAPADLRIGSIAPERPEKSSSGLKAGQGGAWEVSRLHALCFIRATSETTLSLFYKKRPIRDGRQIFENNKRRVLGFPENLRDSL